MSSAESKTAEQREQDAVEEQERAEEAQREWDALDPQERSKRASEQNKKIQRQVRERLKEDEEARLQEMRDSVGKEQVTSTRGMTFKEAAEATEKLNQPPNLGSARERESAPGASRTTGTPPPLTETTTQPKSAKP